MSWSVSKILKPFKKLTVVNYQNLTFKPDKTPLLGFFLKTVLDFIGVVWPTNEDRNRRLKIKITCKNHNCLEPKKMPIYKRDQGVELGTTEKKARSVAAIAKEYELGPLTVRPRCLLEAILEQFWESRLWVLLFLDQTSHRLRAVSLFLQI